MNLRSVCFSIVIEEHDKENNKHITRDMIINYLSNNEVVRFYAFILHDKDINEVGELVRKHYHLVIYLNTAYSKKTIISDIAKSLDINIFCVSARVGDLIESTIYLSHSEEKGSEKYKYSTLDIVTNDITNLNLILSRQTCNLFTSIDYIIQLVNTCSTLTEVYSILGLKDSRLYRAVICDLWKDKKGKNL